MFLFVCFFLFFLKNKKVVTGKIEIIMKIYHEFNYVTNSRCEVIFLVLDILLLIVLNINIQYLSY